MSKYLFLGIAAIAAAVASSAKAYADGVEDPAPGATGEEAPKRGRGRPPGNATPPVEPAASGASSGPTDADRFDGNRALIKPLVEAGQGEEVKKVIAKYSKTGLKDLPATSQADFVKDIEALSY